MNNILFILVIYGIDLEQSPCYLSLCRLLTPDELTDSVYVHDNTKDNIYLAKAYNKGIEIAAARDKQWVVFLDDDTVLTKEYVKELAAQANSKADVLVPQLITDEGKQLSPFYYSRLWGAFSRHILKAKDGYCLSAFNSGTALRRDTIEHMGRMNEKYPMDYLDFWLFHQLDKMKVPVTTMNCHLVHNLSILNYENVSLKRYRQLLDAESTFAAELGWPSVWIYRIRLMMRWGKWALTGHPYAKETFIHLLTK